MSQIPDFPTLVMIIDDLVKTWNKKHVMSFSPNTIVLPKSWDVIIIPGRRCAPRVLSEAIKLSGLKVRFSEQANMAEVGYMT